LHFPEFERKVIASMKGHRHHVSAEYIRHRLEKPDAGRRNLKFDKLPFGGTDTKEEKIATHSQGDLDRIAQILKENPGITDRALKRVKWDSAQWEFFCGSPSSAK
jgi:hypothetical protein